MFPARSALFNLRMPAFAALFSLCACASAPVFESLPAGQAGDPPQLMPLDDLLAQTEAPLVAKDQGAALMSRAARLRARAALMRGSVHDPATRAQLSAAVAAGRA